MTSPDLLEHPFYECMPGRCTGASTNSSNATSCAEGYDQFSPKCATCAPRFIMQGAVCTPCPGRAETSTASTALFGLVAVCMTLYVLAGCFYLSRPALTQEILGRVGRTLSMKNVFRSGRGSDRNLISGLFHNGTLDRESFSKVMSSEDSRLHLTPRESALVFDIIDEDGSGTLSLNELDVYVSRHATADATSEEEEEEEGDPVDRETIEEQVGIVIDIGGISMKIKLFLGFTQCISFFPITFASIPFPPAFLNFGSLLQLFNVDLFALFGASTCDFGTGFYQSFMFSFLLFPLIIGGALFAFAAVGLYRKLNPSKVAYTIESARTRLYTVLFVIVYAVYTGVATKMFLLFKCEEVQGVWYLMADYRIVCFDEVHKRYQTLAFLGILVYVLGIPLGILGVLLYNKKYLHESNTRKEEMYKHLQIAKQFGSIYEDCEYPAPVSFVLPATRVSFFRSLCLIFFSVSN